VATLLPGPPSITDNGTVDAKRATLRDVAAAAGVSRALAGFVLGDDHGKSIPEATRERVRAAAQSLGYAPHGIARALREGSSRVVVLLACQRGGPSAPRCGR
jgi:DNA-binding LacI/PurR family transcriptional regulator